MCDCEDYKPTPLEAMDEMIEDIVFKKQAYLREKGWKYSCQNQGARWMWEKEINGRQYVVGESSAFDFQNEIDQLKRLKERDAEG